MRAKLLLGKTLANKILGQIYCQIKTAAHKPCLAVILVGKNPSSLAYIKIKERACKKTGIIFKKYLLPSTVSENRLINLIKKINLNKKIKGLIVQLPLPSRLNPEKITRLIDPQKDIDGFVIGTKFLSPVHQAVIYLLKQTKINLRNKSAVILANSYAFADPLAKILAQQKIKTNIIIFKKISAHDKKIIRQAKIIITAIGRSHYLRPAMIGHNSIIIDIGFCRKNNKLCGDVDPRCQDKTSHISPVPGGIGPLTVAFLLKNLTKR